MELEALTGVKQEIGGAEKIPGFDDEGGDGQVGEKGSSGVGKKKDMGLKGKPEDVETWKTLAKNAVNAPVNVARDMFETLLKRFPLADKYWLLYCEKELEAGNHEHVERILKRTLITLESVKLWEFYLLIIRKRKLDAAAANPTQRKEAYKDIEEAYNFALEYVGFTYEGGAIWKSFIEFMKGQNVDSTYDVSQRNLAVRTVYQRAVKQPVAFLEEMWKSYEEEEGGVSTESQQDYMKAKTVYLERKKLSEGLTSGDIAVPYSKVSGGKTLERWSSWIEYEQSNPEQLGRDEHKRRVRYIFTKALSALYWYPEVWYAFSQYELNTNDSISASTILEKAIYAVPDSLMLHFAMADFYESQNRIDRAREVYNRLEKRQASPIVFIQSQQFERRVGGIANARTVFRRARQSPACDSTVFTAAALLEFHNNKEPNVARNIFELGLKRFPSNKEFIVQYLTFLEHLNEEAEIITLYERVLAQLDPIDAYMFWERYREFCARFAADGGSLQKLQQVERSMAEKYPDRAKTLTGFAGIAHRYAFLGQYPKMASDLRFFEQNPNLSLGPHARMHDGVPTGLGGHLGRMSSAPSTLYAADHSKTPSILNKVSSLLPPSLGSGINAMDHTVVLRHIERFALPPRASVVISKKKRKIAMVDEGREATNVIEKRRKQ